MDKNGGKKEWDNDGVQENDKMKTECGSVPYVLSNVKTKERGGSI